MGVHMWCGDCSVVSYAPDHQLVSVAGMRELTEENLDMLLSCRPRNSFDLLSPLPFRSACRQSMIRS